MLFILINNLFNMKVTHVIQRLNIWTIITVLCVSLIAPTAVGAQVAVCPQFEQGEVFTTTAGSSVWQVGPNEEKRYYPSGQIFMAWNFDFSEVETIEPRCFNTVDDADSTPFGINHPPGTLIKRVEYTGVYLVGTENRIWRIQNADVAEAIWGEDWEERVKDVASAFWPNYDEQEEVIDQRDQFVDGMIVRPPDQFVRHMYLAGVLYPISGTLTDTMQDLTITPSNALWQDIKGAVTTEQQVTAESILDDPSQVAPEFVLEPVE